MYTQAAQAPTAEVLSYHILVFVFTDDVSKLSLKRMLIWFKHITNINSVFKHYVVWLIGYISQGINEDNFSNEICQPILEWYNIQDFNKWYCIYNDAKKEQLYGNLQITHF